MAAIAHGKAVLTSPPALEMPFFKNRINVLWPNTPTVAAYTNLAEMLIEKTELLKTIEIGAKELSAQFTWKNIARDHEIVLQA